MSAETPATTALPQRSFWSLVSGWNGVKVSVALIGIPLWNQRQWLVRSFFASEEDYWSSGIVAWWAPLRELDSFVVLFQISLLLSVIASRFNAPRWRSVMLVAALLWMGEAGAGYVRERWSSAFWGGRGFSTADLLGVSPLWFSFYSVLIAWLMCDDERLTLRLIVATVLSTLLFRFWIFASIGDRHTVWVVLLFAHAALVAAGAGFLRLSRWEWVPQVEVLPTETEKHERRQFAFFHLLLAVSCTAVLVVGLRPQTQLHIDLKQLFEGWRHDPPLEWPLLALIPVVSAGLSLLGVCAALGHRRWWWPLVAAVFLSIGAAMAATAYAESLRDARFPFSRITSRYNWPREHWPWLSWCLLLTLAPFALLTAVRTAGYRWRRRGR